MSASSSGDSDRGDPAVAVNEIKLRFVEDGRDGLIAWASCVLNGIVVLNNIGVRRGHDGGLFLTYPNKVTAAGTKVTFFHPISREASAVLEDAILRRLAEIAGAAGARRSEGEAV